MEFGVTATGKMLVLAGAVLIIIGGLFWLSGRFPQIGLGRLPGDILIKRDNFTFYFPLGTSILISVIISLIWWLISSVMRR
ncbi:MAG: DUF2905 domain-containing protein [Acidobacteria bacterium]|nr:DUF2905 domain-containing protein [Acidobacteriota bacterium]